MLLRASRGGFGSLSLSCLFAVFSPQSIQRYLARLSPKLPRNYKARASSHSGAQLLFFWQKQSFIQASPRNKYILLIFSLGLLSESFGRKNVLLYVIIVFLTGSIISARSISMEMLVAGRTIQGLGGGGLITLVEVSITDLIPLADRGMYWSFLALVWLVGSVVGRSLF